MADLLTIRYRYAHSRIICAIAMSMDKTRRRIDSLKAARARAEQERQYAFDNQAKVYEERDLLIGALARVYPSHLMQNSRNGKPVLCIHTPSGQLAWTLHTASDRLRSAIADLPVTHNDWDRAKTADRLDRLEQLARVPSL